MLWTYLVLGYSVESYFVVAVHSNPLSHYLSGLILCSTLLIATLCPSEHGFRHQHLVEHASCHWDQVSLALLKNARFPHVHKSRDIARFLVPVVHSKALPLKGKSTLS